MRLALPKPVKRKTLQWLKFGLLAPWLGAWIGLAATAAGIRPAFCHASCWMAPFLILGQTLGKALRQPFGRLPDKFGLQCLGPSENG